MPHTYTLLTIKNLFGLASSCAYPGCRQPLIFEERGVKTPVCQIAHIRSEKQDGPRHDPAYLLDIDGVDNLLLLCGTHHPPVDRHESLYKVQELEEWQAAQRRGAALHGGTPISVDDAQGFLALSSEAKSAIAQVARLSQRVVRTCEDLRRVVGVLDAERLEAIQKAQHMLWGATQTDRDGKQSPFTESVRLSPHEEKLRANSRKEAADRHYGPMQIAVNALAEEIAVLRMIDSGVAGPASRVEGAAEELVSFWDESADIFERARLALQDALSHLWR